MMDGAGEAIRYPWETPPEPGAAVEVAEGVLWLRQPLPMKLDHVNVYALDEGDGWTLVDTGFDTRKSRVLWQAALEGPLKGRPIRRVIVTHHHPDHVGLAGWFQQDHGAELVTTRTAWLFARMLQLDAQDRPSPETVAYWRACGMDPEILSQRMEERPFNFADCVAPLPLGFTRIRQGDVIRAGGRDWDVHVGNGHAPEHATLWSRDDGLVLAGDQMLPSISSNIGVYATEPEADPVGEWLEACERLATLARPDQLVLGGHKLPFTGLPLRMAQLIDNHHGALERLHAHIATPKAAGECFAPLFKRRIGPGEYGLALVEAMAHCLHLWHTGRATRQRRDDGAWAWQAA
ncbi:MBL fold metallo-hydrolase [Pseudoponticoccus marisrubri]|uniref:MBL fold metallo-hydrolase n=1 Tax=Pseudoponticoccus marisrubri TaxID=1685382 RepID=A0A0W7WGQ2_9RHOB|nr:MBL fold metallo-hydrolase [Pseudoponticoccus marisrubri]KUF09750.1 MBL fold metallo-hydrolase [Pseudoponticoccus marisrubri]